MDKTEGEVSYGPQIETYGGSSVEPFGRLLAVASLIEYFFAPRRSAYIKARGTPTSTPTHQKQRRAMGNLACGCSP